MSKLSLIERIRASLAKGATTVFLRRDFDRFGEYDSVGKALRTLVRQGTLVKAGYGIYVKTRPSSLNGKPIPVVPLVEIGMEVMRKLGVHTNVGTAMHAYIQGHSTQIPMAAVVNVGRSRVNRRIGIGRNVLRYERKLTKPD